MDDVLEKIVSASDFDTLWTVVREYCFSQGASKISYHHLQGLDGVEHGPGVFLHAEGFPTALYRKYRRENLIDQDPIAEYALRSYGPFFWTDIEKLVPLNLQQRRFLKMLFECDIGDGLAIPLFGPGMRNGYSAVGLQNGLERWDAFQVTRFQVIGQAAHLQYCKLTANWTDFPSLSPREKEILRWMAMGKSNSTIAEILSVSRHTVDTLIRRIYDKLGVADRTTAALKGIGVGLIPFRG